MWSITKYRSEDQSRIVAFLYQHRGASMPLYLSIAEQRGAISDHVQPINAYIIEVNDVIQGVASLSESGDILIQADPTALIDELAEGLCDRLLAEPLPIKTISGSLESVELLMKRFVYWGVWTVKPTVKIKTCFSVKLDGSTAAATGGAQLITDQEKANHNAAELRAKTDNLLFRHAVSPLRTTAQRQICSLLADGEVWASLVFGVQGKFACLLELQVDSSVKSAGGAQTILQLALGNLTKLSPVAELFCFVADDDEVMQEILFDVGLTALGQLGQATVDAKLPGIF